MPPRLRTLLIVLAVVVYALLGLFPYLASVLIAPPVGVAFLMAAWLGGLVAALWFARQRSLIALAIPPVAIAFWFAVVTLGEQFLGWTA
jgi:hypothetical protein